MNRLGTADNLRKKNTRITGAVSALSEHMRLVLQAGMLQQKQHQLTGANKSQIVKVEACRHQIAGDFMPMG